MTRGKHGKAAAQRRAASAEDQLDRLLPQLHEAKRVANQYRSDAEATVALRAEVAKLRDTVGVPMPEHESTVRDLQERHRVTLHELEQACGDLFGEFARWVVVDQQTNWINAHLMARLQAVPRPIADGFLRALGLEREMARFLLNGDPNRLSHSQEMQLTLNQLALKAREVEGMTGGKIPMSYLSTEHTNEDYRDVRSDPLVVDVGESTADMLDAVRAFAGRHGHDSDENTVGPLLRRVYEARSLLITARVVHSHRLDP